MPGQRYQPLLGYLATVPAAWPGVQLTLAEVEAIIDRPLPFSARATASFWTAGAVADRNWQRLGWTARLNRHDRTVTFTRLAL